MVLTRRWSLKKFLVAALVAAVLIPAGSALADNLGVLTTDTDRGYREVDHAFRHLEGSGAAVTLTVGATYTSIDPAGLPTRLAFQVAEEDSLTALMFRFSEMQAGVTTSYAAGDSVLYPLWGSSGGTTFWVGFYDSFEVKAQGTGTTATADFYWWTETVHD